MTDNQRFVVDANILIQAFVREKDSARVNTLLRGLIEPMPYLLNVPEFCLLECTNILWKRVRFDHMPISTAQLAIASLTSLTLTIRPVTILLARALDIGVAHQLAIYDSVYIALAERLACPLITVDERQAKVAVALGITLKPITDFAEFIS